MKNKKKHSILKDHVEPASVVVYEGETVSDVLLDLRSRTIEGKVIYLYVLDKEERLQGIVSTRRLLLAELDDLIEDIMDRAVFCLKESDTFEKAMRSLSSYRLLALPVVDKEHRLKGVVDIQMCLDENVNLLKEQINLDVFQLLGMTLEEEDLKSPVKSYSKRMPWILCNMIGGIGCAIISYLFRVVLGKVLILAMFIPLVLSLSEAISVQSMAQSLQILRKQHVSKKRIALQVLSEIRVALLMAVTSGILVGVISSFWSQESCISFTIGTGIMFSVVISALIGASIPLLLHLQNLDPKVASGPVVLTLADVITTSIYLSLATWWLL
jgi:magnesium transporter